ncbi:cell adhesion molecule Dscam1-like isoform X2 [Planococcus citri]|uniref:cell adhesion molecule Dscam1-like isoform X2 n=1 Tax=Planococcus citri TaxID=170843 RepID=UPI0031F786F1
MIILLWGLLIIEYCYGFGLPSSHMHGPSFLEEPPGSIDFTNSSGAVINCRGQGNPAPDIKWIDASHKEILNMPRLRETLSNGSLYFSPFSLNDFRSEIHQMTYKCVLSNTVGIVVSRECKVRADILYTVDVQVSNVYVVKGNVAMLRCSTPPSIRLNLFGINWLKDDPQEGRSIITPGGRYVQTNTGELHIRDVTGDDSRVRFYCQLTNKLTDERYFSQPGHIIVSESENVVIPKIEYSSSNVQAHAGDSVDLICVAQAYPPPTYRWYHEVAGSLQEIRSGAAVYIRPQLSVLQFPRVQSSDSSLYVCMASNNMGEDKREMKLTVHSPLIAFIRPQKQVVDSASQATFNCSVQGGIGDTTIYWLKDGDRLYDSHNIEIKNKGETLTLKSVGRNDSGMYQCFAQNHEETAQAAAELILGDVSPEFQDTFIEETLQPGLPVSLRCIANGNPPPRINWYLDGGLIHAGDGFFIGSFLDSKGNVVGHLNVSNVRLEHGGLYTCKARNFLGVVEHSAMLNIYGPPTSRSPLNLTAVSGTSIQLRCPVSGFPITSTTWFSESEPITDQITKKTFNNGTLLLTNLEEERDKGKYTCNVYNQQGMFATGIIFLNIMAPPEIMPFHPSNNLKEGGKTNLVCSVTSGDSPITFAWRKDGKPLPHDPDTHEHVTDMISTLRLNNLAARHTGQYTCIATNPAATANYTVRLIVKASPIWSIEPQDTTVLYHHSVVINCQASGFPTPRILWTKSKEKKGDFTTLESNTRLTVHSNGSIVIRNAERQHEGYYDCRADNDIGAPISKTIFLKVNIPAHFRIKNLNQSEIAGRSVVLTCEAEGELPIGITWNSSPNMAVYTKQTPNSVISELHLDYLTRRHAGVYRCTATNRFGQDYMIIHLSVKEPPESPQNVEVIEAGSRWLKVKWASTSNDNVNYIIQYRSLHETTWSNITTQSAAQVNLVETLTPNTVYLVRVIAVNEVGKSKASIEITGKTTQEAPSGHPTDISIEKVTTDTIILRWKVLSPEFWNGELLGYRIFFMENNRNSNPRSRTIRNVDANRVTIYNLRPYTTYDISIKAFNQIGEGPSSPSLTVTTLESTPTSAPQNVHCTASSSESLRVRWDKPPPQHWNGVLQGYKISYQQFNPKPGIKVYTEYKKTSSLETIIHGLKKYTNYSIRVLATTNAGDGVQSSHVQCVTMEDVPGSPDEIKALVMSSDSVMLVWNPPKEPGGKILKYNVYIQSDGEEPRKETVFGDEITRHIFRKLTEFHKYEFWITASTIIGEGQSSIKVSQVLSSQIQAKISSFSKTIIGVAGSHLTLECNAVGLPTPSCSWKKVGSSHLPSESKILLDKSLWISELKSEDAANYSCNAENVYGSDRVTYDVVVVQPPASPILQYVSSSKQTVTLKWKNQADGGSPILGHVIFAQTDNEELSIFVEAEKTGHTVMNLKCGTKYSFQVETLNSVGRSEKSNAVSARTKGDVPESSSDNELFFVNSTSVTLFLDGWPEKECPIQYFTIMYKLKDNWIPVGRGHLMPQPTTISNLIPASLYSIKITAHNEAGKTPQNFAVITRSSNGEIVPIELIDQSRVSIISQLNFIIPMVSGIICLISIAVCAVILMKRRKVYAQYKSGETTLNNSRAELEHPPPPHPVPIHPQNAYSPAHVLRKNSSLSMHKDNIDDYDVYPYATFTVPSQLHTFNQRDCNDGNMLPDNTHSLQRKRKNSSKNSTDTLNLACISNQQTLPIGRKTSFGVMTTAFNDSESINPISRHKKHYIKRTADIGHDSSTESAEMSPETTRRPRGRHGPTSRDHLKPAKLQKSYSNGCEISEPESDQNLTDKSCSKLLQHEKFNQELSSIVNEYRKRRIKRDDDDYDMIHV